MARRAKTVWTIDEVRAEARACMEEGNKIIEELKKTLSHFQKMAEYYESWEDRLNVLDKVINEIEDDSGISREDVLLDQNDAIADIGVEEDDDPLAGLDDL